MSEPPPARPFAPVTFIVGPPRSGSTLLFQLLTHLLHVHYPDKLACRLTRWGWSRLGFRLSGALQRGSDGHGCFSSRFGHTTARRSIAPDEGGDLFHRHFPRGGDETRDAPCRLAEFRALLRARGAAQTPFVMKNLEADNWIETLARSLPESRFLRIRRHPFFCAQSLLLARRREGIGAETDWGPVPREEPPRRFADEHERVALQVAGLERQLEADLPRCVSAERRASVHYADLLAQPASVVRGLAGFLGGPPARGAAEHTGLGGQAERVRLGQEDTERLVAALRRVGADPRLDEDLSAKRTA